jgi:hypothetical protein
MEPTLAHEVDKPLLDGGPDDMRAAMDRVMALAYLLNARLAEVEQSNAELRALAGLDPPAPTIGAQWKTITQVAHLTGHAESTVRSWILSGKIEARKIGGSCRSAPPPGAAGPQDLASERPAASQDSLRLAARLPPNRSK